MCRPSTSRNGHLGQKPQRGTLARFRQINISVPRAHHDALEFSDGTIVQLARLYSGQHATVLQLPMSPASQPTSSTKAKLPQDTVVE